MADNQAYERLPAEDKVRVNSVILKALETAEPKGIVGAFQAGLDAASTESQTRNASRVLTKDAIESRRSKFQTMLDGARDDLSTPPVLATLKSAPSSGLSKQLNAFRALQDSMGESSANATDAQFTATVKRAIATDEAPVFGGSINNTPAIKGALVNFIAREQVAATQESAKNAPEVREAPKAPAVGKGR